MANVTVRPVLQLFPQVDRRLPSGRWISRATLTGDGATALIQVNLAAGSSWSLEDIFPNQAVLGTADWLLNVNTGEDGGLGLEYVESCAISRATTAAEFTSFAGNTPRRAGKSLIWRPGTFFRPEGSVITINAGVLAIGVLFNVDQWGWTWDNESWKLPGGPTRPGEVPQGGYEAISDTIQRAGDRILPPQGVVAPTYGSKLK